VQFGGGAAQERGELFRAGTLGAAELGELRARHQQWLDSGGRAGGRPRRAARARPRGPDPDIIVLATPEMAGLASWIIALVAAGGLAAALSTAAGCCS
jgi:cation/acetate symporter